MRLFKGKFNKYLKNIGLRNIFRKFLYKIKKIIIFFFFFTTINFIGNEKNNQFSHKIGIKIFRK